MVFIEVPNCENPRILDNSIKHHPHVYNFTTKSLKNLFESCGYEILEIGPYSEKNRNYVLKFFLMALQLNNYRKANDKDGEMLIVLAKPRR